MEARPYEQNVFSVGPAILWFPLFALGHVATLLSQACGWMVPADGYSAYYQGFVYVGNSLYALAGLLLTAKFVGRYCDPLPTLVSSLGIALASQLTYYFWSFS